MVPHPFLPRALLQHQLGLVLSPHLPVVRIRSRVLQDGITTAVGQNLPLEELFLHSRTPQLPFLSVWRVVAVHVLHTATSVLSMLANVIAETLSVPELLLPPVEVCPPPMGVI
jgi:hypothetical protein